MPKITHLNDDSQDVVRQMVEHLRPGIEGMRYLYVDYRLTNEARAAIRELGAPIQVVPTGRLTESQLYLRATIDASLIGRKK